MDDKTRELLALMATKLGAKVTELSEHLVNYTYVSGCVGTAIGAIIFLIGVKMAFVSRKFFREDEESAGEACVAIAAGCFAIGTLVFCFALIDVLEPTGATIKGLL